MPHCVFLSIESQVNKKATMKNLSEIFGTDPAKFDLNSIGPALDRVMNILLGLSGVIALLFLIWGGILYITAAGNAEQAGRAKATLTWSFVGIVLIIAAYAIVKYFAKTVISDSPF